METRNELRAKPGTRRHRVNTVNLTKSFWYYKNVDRSTEVSQMSIVKYDLMTMNWLAAKPG